MRVLLTIILSSISLDSLGQLIADPCFASISPVGFFNNSENIVNLCGTCNTNFLGSNLIEWDGTKWLGQIPAAQLRKPPPSGCNTRAMWSGSKNVTPGGEAFALKLFNKLQAGTRYSFTLTYCKDGQSPGTTEVLHRPTFYTSKERPLRIQGAYEVGKLSGATDWRTETFTFVADAQQQEHGWIIIHAIETSGTILADCVLKSGITNFDKIDTVLCVGNSWELNARLYPSVSYQWSTGETTPSITVSDPGSYSLTIGNHNCENFFSTTIGTRDCELRLVMPNFFSPNGDEYNRIFLPNDSNFISSGVISIYDRWGKQIFSGDLFTGWDGGDSPSSVYFYTVEYIDDDHQLHSVKGIVNLKL